MTTIHAMTNGDTVIRHLNAVVASRETVEQALTDAATATEPVLLAIDDLDNLMHKATLTPAFHAALRNPNVVLVVTHGADVRTLVEVR
ncbi:hypothetical protein [Luteococcus peritonei]|uniref:Uncharacterized protein n=1 Tax=Luteococcus peritonei TaxID=88874 RepID=A0ABW4RWU7_9ACTN